MKNRVSYLFMGLLLASLTTVGQGAGIKDESGKGSFTRMDLQRTIRLENDSKSQEVTIDVKENIEKLELLINCSVSRGKLIVEIYDPKGVKKGNFTVGTQLNTEGKETVNGNIQKSLIDPQSGDWKVKFIPTDATGSIWIQTSFVELSL